MPCVKLASNAGTLRFAVLSRHLDTLQPTQGSSPQMPRQKPAGLADASPLSLCE
jgi:hypothetical protein